MQPKSSLPEIKPQFGISAILLESEMNDNPLYRKSLSELALVNLTKIANLSLYGLQSKDQLEQHIRESLNIKKQQNYLNMQLDKSVSKIIDDKNLMSKRRRKLLCELQRLEAKPQIKQHSRLLTDQSQLSTIVEDNDRENKLMAIINTEGRLLQIQRRYQQSLQNDQALKQQVQNNYCKYKDRQDMQIESLPLLTQSEIKQGVTGLYYDNDLSQQRYEQRLNEKHQKEKKKIWHLYHFPKANKKWSRLEKTNENIK